MLLSLTIGCFFQLPLQEQAHGISLEDYIKIFAVLIHIDDVDKVRQAYVLACTKMHKKLLNKKRKAFRSHTKP